MNETTNRPGCPPASWVPLPVAAPTAGCSGSNAVHESGPGPMDDAPAPPAPTPPRWRIPTDPPPV